MYRHWPGHRKLVHVDATMCAEMSNTADGTKCLREPMSTPANDSKTSRRLLPHPSYKSVKSCDQTSQLLGTSESSYTYVNVDGTSDTDGPKQEELTEVQLIDNDGDSVSKSAQPKCSVEFVSARKYMNPTLNLLQDNVPQNSIDASIQPIHGSVQVSKPSRKPNSRHVATVQSNSLDRYFKPFSVSKPSTAPGVMLTQSHTVWSAGRSATCSVTPESSPRKSVLSSPLSKLPGSDTIYICSPSSQSSRSSDSVTSSQGSSCARNVFKDYNNCASALSSSDADDVDFQASFDGVWKTNPGMKRKPAEQSGHAAKKKAVSSDMSAESFGLFGFSNNTLLALESDTDFEDDATEYISSLPQEVVSNILCRLPFNDLCLNVNRVCVSWKNIIDSDDVSFVTTSCVIICIVPHLSVSAHLSVPAPNLLTDRFVKLFRADLSGRS